MTPRSERPRGGRPDAPPPRPSRQAARAARTARAAAAVLLAAVLPACDLDVKTPTIVLPESVTGAGALPTLLAGASGDFGIAFAGDDEQGEEGTILVGGLRGDEFLNRDTFEQRRDIDVGSARPDNASLVDLYRNTHRARRSAEFAAQRFAQFGPDEPGAAEAENLAGYATLLLAETFCPGVTLSRLDEAGKFVYGRPLTLAQLLDTASAHFDRALAAAGRAGGSRGAEQASLARVGKARALLSRGSPASIVEAGALVAAVPTSFRYVVEYSENSARQNNAVFTFNNVRRRWGVADAEGENGYAYVDAADPRVRTLTTSRNGLDGEDVPIVNQLRFPARTSGIPLADGVEARLIEAEAAMVAGDVPRFLALHNALRANAALLACPSGLASCTNPSAGLPALTADAASPRELAEVHFRERAFWLFATGHRLGDMRRLLRPPYSAAPYGFTYETVYPIGQYFKQGRVYQEQPSLPLPIEEQNNPNFQGCTAAN